ncbi:MAG: hypothetical protein REJ23_03095 [Brevundimonas sp.]|nr:hypothetical protein [Brevundimonas sp.]
MSKNAPGWGFPCSHNVRFWTRLTMAGLALAQPAPVFAKPIQAAQDRPAQADCAAVRDVDLSRLQRQMDRERRTRERQGDEVGPLSLAPEDIARGMVDVVQIADWASRRPSAEASVVIRARMGPGGGHATDHKSVVWREPDGSWWFWRQTLGGPPAPPGPPPPRDAVRGSPEWLAWESTQPPADRSMDDRNYPPVEGRLAPAQSQQMEAAWADPCRPWDPAFWPLEIPLKRRIDGSNRRLCAQDSSAIYAEITEPGHAPRVVGGACSNDGPTYRMIQIATYASSGEADGR